MFAVMYAAEGTGRAELEAVAREFSPRIEWFGPCEVALDAGGVGRLFGDARTVGHELRRTAADRGLRVRVAMAPTRTAARLLVRHRAGVTVADDDIASALAPLPLSWLPEVASDPIGDDHAGRARASNGRASAGRGSRVHGPTANDPDAHVPGDPGARLLTLKRWGLRTLGELAALPAGDVAARLGQEGVAWQRLARGEDPHPLVPSAPEERFEQALDLEWPIEGLEPLSFVLGRLMEPLEQHLLRRDRGAAVLHVRLHLVDRTVHARSLQLPAPMRDARALRTLALLDLESHPPAAAIDRVIVAVDPTPGRVVQFSLLARALPPPERLSTLLARLGALMGEQRCGAPALVDTWQPGACAMRPFVPRDAAAVSGTPRSRLAPGPLAIPGDAGIDDEPALALRRCRMPVPARVRVEDGRPVRVTIDRPSITGRSATSGGGLVQTAAGPWRTSGNWWTREAGEAGEAGRAPRRPTSPHAPQKPWDRDEWDVLLADGATYRLFRERDTGAWFVEGVVD